MRLVPRMLCVACAVSITVLMVVPGASATPVCTGTDNGGLPFEACGGRVFPEAEQVHDYVQYTPDPATGVSEFVSGIETLSELYPRWISVFTLRDHYDDDDAVSVGPDRLRSYHADDTGDGFDIYVIKLTDHDVPDEGKETLFYSLSVHGDEIGGREGAFRAIEDLAIDAGSGGEIVDGVEGYESTTGTDPEIRSWPVADVLANEIVYFAAFNVDGWVKGDHFAPVTTAPADYAQVQAPRMYTRGNWLGTDLNRQMPTVGWISQSRNPLAESEMLFGHRFMQEAAETGVGGQLAYGADIHGESQSRALVDIMYPAGQFDSVKHRRLMSIAERTKSVIDATLYGGAFNEVEENTGGDAGEGIEDFCPPVAGTNACENVVPTKPARWGTVWDTLGYTDTGFIGDYLATELGVTGMDYEIAYNHSDYRAHSRAWNYLMQENFINATRGIIKTAMAYAMTEREDFADFEIDPGGRVGYVSTPGRVTDSDANGPGRLPGPGGLGVGQNGVPVDQVPYSASQLDFFVDEAEYVKGGIQPVNPAAIAVSPETLDQLDTLVLADLRDPASADGEAYDSAAYFANLKSWVEAGGNLVLTDRALHVLGDMGVLDPSVIEDVEVYQPYSNIQILDHPMVEGLRSNARQLAEFTLIGYGIGNNESPMTVIDKAAWEAEGGVTVGTTGNNSGGSDDLTQTSVGELPLGDGVVRILGGGLHEPTEENDHRYGLKDYALTYSGLFILENSMKHDAPGLGFEPTVEEIEAQRDSQGGGLFDLLAWFALVPLGLGVARRRRHRALTG